MKALFFLFVAAVICIQCNGQFTGMCLPQPMKEVPIMLQMWKVPHDLSDSACGDDGLLAIPELTALAEERIISQYNHVHECRLDNLKHISCRTGGGRRKHVTLRYMANLTCSDKCYHLGMHDWNNKGARNVFYNKVVHLRDTYRSRPRSDFWYDEMQVRINYFSGVKGDFRLMCSKEMVHGGLYKKLPACICPSNCTDPCELPSETGHCQGNVTRYYHNATSGQCEEFTYGGCGGNENRFTTQVECEKACKVCPEGMVYQECGTACPTTCDSKDEMIPCTFQCVQGCFCEEGTVLLEEDGEVCVAHEDCPVTGSGQCPEGMVYQECGTACPTTCDNRNEVASCTQPCKSGCFCSEGMVLLEAEGDKCVASENCLIPEDISS